MKNSKAKSDAQARTEFASKNFRWLEQVARDRRANGCAMKVAFVISQRTHFDTGEAFPGTPYIAKFIGVAQSTVHDAMEKLVALGHLRLVRGKQGRGCSNRYWMVLKTEPGKYRPTDISDSEDISASRYLNIRGPISKYRPADKTHCPSTVTHHKAVSSKRPEYVDGESDPDFDEMENENTLVALSPDGDRDEYAPPPWNGRYANEDMDDGVPF